MEETIKVEIYTPYGTFEVPGELSTKYSSVYFTVNGEENNLYFGNVEISEKMRMIKIIPNMYYGDRVIINNNNKLRFKLDLSNVIPLEEDDYDYKK